MKKKSILFLIAFITLIESKAQEKPEISNFHTQSFGVQGGLSLLENPFVLYPMVNLQYSKTIYGKKRHQLAIFPQLGAMFLPNIETKILTSVSLQYKYISKKRFEANLFLGINYQLRRLAYAPYEFENNILTEKNRYLHQFGPTIGVNFGYKVMKKEKISITPILGISLTKLNKIYQPNLFGGYKPSITFGMTFNK